MTALIARVIATDHPANEWVPLLSKSLTSQSSPTKCSRIFVKDGRRRLLHAVEVSLSPPNLYLILDFHFRDGLL